MNHSSDQPKRVLVVEDEPHLAAVLCDYLKAAGYDTESLDDGLQAMATFSRWQPDLVLLDLTLPGMDGIDLCRALRADSDIPVIMITARVEEMDRLLGLEVGADDYICKPFSPREVVARVVAVLRRYKNGAIAAPKGLKIDRDGYRASLRGQQLDLTPVEFRLLCTLSDTPGRVWSRDQLMNHLYTDYRVVTDRTVDSHVKNLRHKLAEAGAGDNAIASIYGVGYRFDLE